MFGITLQSFLLGVPSSEEAFAAFTADYSKVIAGTGRPANFARNPCDVQLSSIAFNLNLHQLPFLLEKLVKFTKSKNKQTEHLKMTSKLQFPIQIHRF